MKGRRFIRFLTAAVLSAAVSLAAAAVSFAATGMINFSDPEATVGQEVNVTMKITAEEGTALSSANVTLKYPEASLEFVSGTDADGGAGIIRVHGASNGAGTNILEYNLKFNVKAAGTHTVEIGDIHEAYDSAEQPLTFDHLGSSAISAAAPENASVISSLGSLEVYPGDLEPGFDAGVTEYNVTVGAAVDKLTVNAVPEDGSAGVTISGNEEFVLGENTVVISVRAADGQSSTEYILHVNKTEGGPEGIAAETEAPSDVEGVQLSSKGKTITIMNPSADVEIPAGFRTGTISIDGHKVQGWIWDADTDPQYCVVYGMNDQGEINFYRYDMGEKTIQRYFEDPLAADAVSSLEHSAVQNELSAAKRTNELRFLIICILAVICFILVMLVIYLSVRISTLGRSEKRQNDTRRHRQEYIEEEDDEAEDKNLLKHEFVSEDDEEEEEKVDETQVIRRPERRRRQRRDVSETEFEDLDI